MTYRLACRDCRHEWTRKRIPAKLECPSCGCTYVSPAIRQRESDFQREVVALARLNGWRVHHQRPGMTRSGKWASQIIGQPGWPDLVMVRYDEAIFVELKSTRGELTPDQDKWLSALALADLEVHVWRPADMPRIVERLKRRGLGRGAA